MFIPREKIEYILAIVLTRESLFASGPITDIRTFFGVRSQMPWWIFSISMVDSEYNSLTDLLN